jgi:hypothetical protein
VANPDGGVRSVVHADHVGHVEAEDVEELDHPTRKITR